MRPWRARVTFGLLYFAEGAPIGFIWWTLPTMLRSAGVSVERITTLTSLVVLPWALKLVWAPLVDVLAGGRFPLRAWIGINQLAMAATLLPIAFLDPLEHFDLVTALLVAHAFAAATQDVAVDALCIASVPAHQRGAINGWMQAGMLLGRALFGGAALVFAAEVGRPAMVTSMVVLLVTLAIGVLFFGPVTKNRRRASFRGLARAMAEVLRNRHVWAGFAFALTASASFQGVGSVVGPYLVDHDVPEATIGVFFALGSVSAMVSGALVGGRLADRFGRRAVVVAGQLTAASAIVALAFASERATLLTWSALIVMYLGVGLFTAAVFALFMDHTDPRLGATQFSSYMGLMNLCESWSARLVGALTTRAGYATAFSTAAAIGVLVLPLLFWMRPKRPEPASIPAGSGRDLSRLA